MIMSEFGADGFYGYRSPTRVKGTEERQAEIIEKNLRLPRHGRRVGVVTGVYTKQQRHCGRIPQTETRV